MTFKERFKFLLEEHDLTARKLGKLLNIDHASIYMYLQGSFPNIKNSVILANYFNCTLNFLFGLDAYPDEYEFFDKYQIKDFFDKYCTLLKQNNLSHYKVSKDLGFGNSMFKAWQHGSEPKIETLLKLANYFDVPVDWFISRCN